MQFTLDIDLAAITGDAHEEVARILRFWAGNVKHYPLADGDGSAIYDSSYAEVGAWRVHTGAPGV